MVLSQILVGFVDGKLFKGDGFSSNALLVLRETSVKKENTVLKTERLMPHFVFLCRLIGS